MDIPEPTGGWPVAKSVFLSLCQNVLQQCQQTGVPIPAPLADYLVRYCILAHPVLLGGSAITGIRSAANEDGINKVVSLCVAMATDPQSATAATLRLWFTHLERYDTFLTVEGVHADMVDKATQSAIANLSSSASSEAIFSHLHSYALSLSFSLVPGGGGLNVDKRKEMADAVEMALGSVLPRADASVFRDLVLRNGARSVNATRQLVELYHVVNGIRIMGHNNLSAIPDIIGAFETTVQSLQDDIAALEAEIADRFTAPLLQELECGNNAPASQAKVRALIEAVINRRGLLTALSELHRKAEEVRVRATESAETLQTQLERLGTLVSSKQSVPKAEVYPRFIGASQQHALLLTANSLLQQLREWARTLLRYRDTRNWTPLCGERGELLQTTLVSREDHRVATLWLAETKGAVRSSATAAAGREGGVMATAGESFAIDRSSSKSGLARWLVDIDEFSAVPDEVLSSPPLLLPVCPMSLVSPALARSGAPLPPSNDPSLLLAVPVSSTLPSDDKQKERASGRGGDVYGFLSFRSLQERAAFIAHPGLTLAGAVALPLSSPRLAALIPVLGLDRLASVLMSPPLTMTLQDLKRTPGFPSPIPYAEYTSDRQLHPGQPCPIEALTGAQNPPDPALTNLSKCDALWAACMPGPADDAGIALAGAPLSGAQANSGSALTRYSYRELCSTSTLVQYQNLLSSAVGEAVAKDRQGTTPPGASVGVTMESAVLVPTRQALARLGTPGLSATGNSRGQSRTATQRVSDQFMRHGDPHAAVSADAEVQTPVHFVERNMVKGYTSSEWVLRNRAIRLANVTTKVTHSAQTDQSHYRRTSTTQTHGQKAHSTQTSHSVGTHATQHTRVIRGLRGRSDHLNARDAVYPERIGETTLVYDPNTIDKT
ncbi:protein of unknown function DUF3508 [Kipferlia bialata]|uniref:Cilia- and flagella-associated protein 206 n=1 Tax=Kipferlia bialata TaxID=797122 RepID=A0A9K3CTF8_9EUKA|nr:protein of unknown function DUF3508 [Kipferlia bialata]|eukprot:g3129.t1